MLTARSITLYRGTATVLDNVSLTVGPGSRVGIVGPNGVGKSTFLRILAGAVAADAGTVERAPAALRVGFLSQELDSLPAETMAGYLARRTGVAAATAELDRLTAALSEATDEIIEAYSDALDRFLAYGGDDFEARAATVASSVGLGGDMMEAEVATLSGGQASRVGLAAILLARFDVFLLDEPTNDLDFAGLELLEDFLQQLAGAAVIVSHDRAFLDRAVTRILEIEEHHHSGTEYAGGWSEYVDRRALARTQKGQAYESWKAERDRLRERIRSQRSWSEHGVKTKTKKPKDNDKAQRGFAINRTEKQASKVRQSERAIERLGELEKPWEGWELRLDLGVASRSGDVVARLDEAVVDRGRFRLGPVTAEVGWADRIAITGPNGGGKSTLLGALFGDIELSAGRSWVGPSVVRGELSQRRHGLPAGLTLIAGFEAVSGLRTEESRSLLAKFGLGTEHVVRPFELLSPGERTRATLAVLMATATNCLVLDEPTNHLDLPAIEQLEGALETFEGTLLVVSHDRWLLESLRVNRTWMVSGGQLTETTE